MTVKLWDIEKGMNINTLEAHDQLIQDVVWDYYGTTYATSCKDKSVRIIDARSPQVAQVLVPEVLVTFQGGGKGSLADCNSNARIRILRCDP